ncbi:MAG TPA: N-acetyltransferase [Leptolyngbyaceae cyanobacterium M65_K2018_010]|nr:N-acetyltransferase [Leptolyngbyaceae cyanobacterium M65_K2018_010]
MTDSLCHPALPTLSPAGVPTSPGEPLLRPRIRPAQLADIPPLTELLASSFYDCTGWKYWVYPVIKFGIQADLRQRLYSEKTDYACLTALVIPPPAAPSQPSAHQQVAGTVEVSQRQAWPWQGIRSNYAYISNLAVAPPFRRQGIAAQLLAACEALAITWEMEDLLLHVMEDNLAACKLYRRAGFNLFQAEATPLTGLGLQPRRLLMHKRLGRPTSNFSSPAGEPS